MALAVSPGIDMKGQTMYSIYALIDPRDKSVRYVGITRDVYQRFMDHIQCSGSNYAKNAWITELRAVNKMIIMQTLEDVGTREQALERENYWIKHYEMLKEPIMNISGTESPKKARRQFRVATSAKAQLIKAEQVEQEKQEEESIGQIVLGQSQLGRTIAITKEIFEIAVDMRGSGKATGYRSLMKPFGLSEHHAKALNRKVLEHLEDIDVSSKF